MPTIDILKSSFRKFLTYTYFDKSDMVLRRNVASFAKMLGDEDAENRIFGQILSVANGENTKLLDEWLEKISLVFMPKKVNPLKLDKSEDKPIITNLPPKRVIVVIQAFAAPFKAQKKRLESDGFRPLFGLGFER